MKPCSCPWSSGRRHSAADKLSCNRPGVLLPRSAGAVLFFSPVSALIFSRKGVISAKMSLPGRFFAKLDQIFEKTLYK